MKLLGLFRKVSLLVGHGASCSSVEPLLACATRRMSSLPEWDSRPIDNRVYFSRKMNPAELVDVIDYFRANPIFDSILSNRLVGKAISRSSQSAAKSTSSTAPHKNPFLEAISEVNLLMVSKAARVAFRSLPELYLDNHLKGFSLGGRIPLYHVRIHRPSGKFVFLDMEREMVQELSAVNRSEDLKGLGDLVREIIDILYPEITIPSDLAHWLSVLERPEPKIRLMMYHPVFLSLRCRFHFHVALDQALRKEFAVGNQLYLIKILQKLAKFKALFGLAALHELLNSQMNKSRKKSKRRSKKKAKAKEEAAAAGPQAAPAAAANVHSGKRKQARRQKTCTKIQHNQTSSTGSTVQSAEEIISDENREEVTHGRDVVSFIRDCAVHGCENNCLHFEFVDIDMLSQQSIVQLLHFIFRDYSHKALEAFSEYGLCKEVDIECLFGEDSNTWRRAEAMMTRS